MKTNTHSCHQPSQHLGQQPCAPGHQLCVIGLGYVGLPLARLFSTKYKTIGFDRNHNRVAEIMSGHDSTMELDERLLKEAIEKNGFLCTSELEKIKECNIYIVAVPTPVDENNRPDLTPLIGASRTVGKVISPGDIVIYESTVYPGVTEEECIPIIEAESGLTYNKDFYAGYSPERINPGDKEHTVEKIKKVTSGSTPQVAEIVDNLYNSVLINGTHKAPSIRVAEASKIIENSQRDVNIAFMNELAKIFNAMGIDTRDVLEAASSKWNFIKMSPGLVGGHCISVDPYYLIQKAQVYGVLPRIMTSARRLNDGMGAYVAEQTIKCMNKKGVLVKDSRILILGITFKENCPDTRNTKVLDIYHTLSEYTRNITIYDPWANPDSVAREYGLTITPALPELAAAGAGAGTASEVPAAGAGVGSGGELPAAGAGAGACVGRGGELPAAGAAAGTASEVPAGCPAAAAGKYDAIILAVAHNQFKDLNYKALLAPNGIIYDVKGFLPRELVDARL
ncbi:MAG: nucleotide sugar dehydrogenase [Candidatus Egerieousia sp.]|nr:nucleotide sugar dehydrogenase [Candidatus Egerieousia sp.]